MTEQITVLGHSTALLTKRWLLGDKGKPKQEDYGFAKTFTAQVIDLNGFDDLCELLDVLATEPKHCVIRGLPLPGRDLSSMLRRKRAHGNEQAYFSEAPHSWVMLDVDLKDTTVDTAYGTAEDCLKVVNTAIAQLPMELRTARCWWQLSSSAGFKPGIRCHLWFWLDRPLGETELTRWGEYANEQAGKIIVDCAVFRTVQPHYTANPVFVDLVDPVIKRTGRIEGPAAALPRLTARTDTWRKKLLPLQDINNEHLHAPIRDACASFFCAHGPDKDDFELRQALRNAVDNSCSLRGVEETKYTDERLQDYIRQGREFARDRAAQGENLALNNDGTPKPTLENIRAIITSAPEWNGVLAFNERRDRPILLGEPPFEDGYRGNRTRIPRDWSNTDDRRLASWLARKHQLAAPSHIIAEAIDVIARENSFDPVQDYLNGLVWDGVPRIDSWLIDCFGADNNSYTQRVGAMWMIQACARAMKPGEKADCVLALESPEQGRRKSTALEVLAGGLDYFREGINDIHSKDTLMCMQGAWIIELREMAHLSNKEAEAIKGFLDRRNDHYRGAYDRRPEDHLRRCVFAATTNKLSYLNDETGARRWWPVLVRKWSIEWLWANRDQLWAEALYRYRAGEKWYVEADDPDFVREQEARYNGDERENILKEALDKGCAAFNVYGCATPKIAKMCQTVMVSQVLEHVFNIAIRDQQRHEQVNVTKMLRHLGWEKRRIVTGNVWARPGALTSPE